MKIKLKACKGCNTIKDITDFYGNGVYKGIQKYKPRCKVCEAREKREKYKGYIKEFYGEIKCQNCGFEGHTIQFDCHHRVPSTKSFKIADAVKSNCSKDKMFSELAKCDLLCANCHRAEHIVE